MQTVSRFEASLLRLLYYFLRREPVERALPLIEARLDAPTCLAGRRAPRRGRPRQGLHVPARPARRLARRAAPPQAEEEDRPALGGTRPNDLGLAFSQHSLRFLIWITAARPGDKTPAWGPDHDLLTHGDLLLLYFAHEGLRDTVEGLARAALRKREPYQRHGLCWLAYPEDFTQMPDAAVPNFEPWIEDAGACILEALQPDLTARWVHVESGKERIEQPAVMRSLGTPRTASSTPS